MNIGKVYRVLVANSKTGFIWMMCFADGAEENMLECMTWWVWNNNRVYGVAIGDWDQRFNTHPVGHVNDMRGKYWDSLTEDDISNWSMSTPIE